MLADRIEATRENNVEKYCRLVGRFPALCSDEVLTYLRVSDYFTAPSSFKKHGAWIGGNFDHSCKVVEFLLTYTTEENLKWEREESPYIIGLFHDMCKCDERGFVEKNDALKVVSLNAPDKRHAEKSIELIESNIIKLTDEERECIRKSIELIESNIIKLTDEERECIRYHMGEYGGEEEYQQEMAKAMAQNSNIAFVQKADTIAAKMGI